MSHANAALTPRARLKVAQLVVDRGVPNWGSRCSFAMLVAHRQTMGDPACGRAAPDRQILPTTHQPFEDAGSDDQTNCFSAAAQTHRSRPTRRLDRSRAIDRAPGASSLPDQPPAA